MLSPDLQQQGRIHPVLGVLLMLLLAIIGFAVGGLFGLYGVFPFLGISESEFLESLKNAPEHPELQGVLFASQAGATLVGLIYAPYLWLRIQRLNFSNVFSGPKTSATNYALTILIIIVSVGLMSAIVLWNQNLHLPESYQWLENFAREYEDRAEEQTKLLTNMGTVTTFLIAMLVIAVLPAIGEELVFRGIIQMELVRGTRNHHVAIWIAGFLFSFIHFQFFGFFPRLLLGVLFGYLYHWSGNLWIPITAHFANNGLQVLMLYLNQTGAVGYDIEQVESLPVNFVIISTILTAGLLVYFYKHFQIANSSKLSS